MKSRRVKALADKLLRAENCEDNVEVSILLTDDENIARLNKDYRHVDGPTDVLSFAQAEPGEEPAGDAGENLLGDVVIAVETARRQAHARGLGLDEEIDILLAHGLLHLLGYEHAESEEEGKMCEKQADVLGLTDGDRQCGAGK